MRRRIDHAIRKLRTWHGERRFHAAFARAVVALVLFVIDPLGVAVQKSHAIDRSFAWLAGNMRSYQPSDRLAVVLIEEEDLRSPGFQVDWPIPYGKTASLIRLLACAGASGVFFDYTASQQFNLAAGQDELETMVRDSLKAPRCNDDHAPPKIPVYFGAAENVDTSFARFLNDQGRAFWIGGDTDEGHYSVGRSEFPTEPLAEAKDQSPAFGIARDLCRLPGEDTALCPNRNVARGAQPLRLFWTANVSKDQHYFLRVGPGMECRDPLTLWEKIGLFFGMTDIGRYQTCPPILTLVARQLFLGDATQFLKGRFVFVGTRLFGLNDAVSSPVHGDLPGVYAHAVALDNLWYLKKGYPTRPKPYILLLMAIVVYIAIELTIEFCRGFKYSGHVRIFARVIMVAGLLVVVSCNQWPYSLLLAIFGYYWGGSALIKAAQEGIPAR